ncbi:thiamine-phosphate kinase [Sodalis sp. CWE]|uniref:thiamine-phosphate kinase n=1 Tax=Sodalis sp. CWE TaxID=2803816 RepID=UPI001C7D7311|nr:thiamine-phosphate kinase [Sodalis sp. CWE]MBX4181206.1 thiamine-phosphate kinase [Sodalis sp. CWE]
MSCKEIDLIDRFFNKMQKTRQDVIMGVGDDCALLSTNKEELIAVSTDTLIAGKHFMPDIHPTDLGYKSLAVNLSDLASMGADPAWLSLAITLPSINEDWLASFSKSLFRELNYHNMQLIGGDITCGPLSLTMTIQGKVPFGCALTRHGACVGDRIYVTGTLGDSAAGLAILQKRLRIFNLQDRQYLLSRHLRPQPRILQGKALRNIASAAIDISDGAIMDLNHILVRSNCGACINLDSIPYSLALLRHSNQDQALHWALSGGEDYELCFTVSPINDRLLGNIVADLNCTNTSFTCIGYIIPKNEGIQFMRNNKKVEYSWSGYTHFK